MLTRKPTVLVVFWVVCGMSVCRVVVKGLVAFTPRSTLWSL
jgi:hypothetical protein